MEFGLLLLLLPTVVSELAWRHGESQLCSRPRNASSGTQDQIQAPGDTDIILLMPNFSSASPTRGIQPPRDQAHDTLLVSLRTMPRTRMIATAPGGPTQGLSTTLSHGLISIDATGVLEQVLRVTAGCRREEQPEPALRRVCATTTARTTTITTNACVWTRIRTGVAADPRDYHSSPCLAIVETSSSLII
ncbi:uncharacterized protein F5Z01DRAFT_246114 [Emericellopsis atlantica]|uniref:Uncharacterized protein n=1 Tax=Emericellopsis atlantica TaxID=2614577 RepID=A0A9P7ZH75_9HYPO|nr:uncharacterized protein F5Z01DRAFT_246114 [Emericellopsis atlantica]KAG9252039.1 hypothetical protein F5Z01DRAFT_246114 [Emericellopsis atlantica]